MLDTAQSPSAFAGPDASVSREAVAAVLARACPAEDCRGQRVLAIVPDGTRTAPVCLCFLLLHVKLTGVAAALDGMIALGTHQPM